MKLFALLGAAALSTMSVSLLQAQPAGVTGDWKEPSGSVIRIAPCGGALCARLVVVSSSAPATVDGNNPDAALRTRPLCGLQIGEGFHGTDPNRAEDGKLYDPRNGKTYKGEMTSEGNVLLLRGYIGVKAFGRTARWERVTAPVQTCSTEQTPASVQAPATVTPAPAAGPANSAVPAPAKPPASE